MRAATYLAAAAPRERSTAATTLGTLIPARMQISADANRISSSV
jgi:hypothetical protein